MVLFNAYGLLDNITYPLMFKVFRPRCRLLQAGDKYKTKPQLAEEIIRELKSLDFRLNCVS